MPSESRVARTLGVAYLGLYSDLIGGLFGVAVRKPHPCSTRSLVSVLCLLRTNPPESTLKTEPMRAESDGAYSAVTPGAHGIRRQSLLL